MGNETKRKILEAAKKAFSKYGYDGVSMEEIAHEAGVKKALIYYYFPSKDKLFEEVWREAIEELENHLFAVAEETNSYFAKIKKFLRSYVDFVLNKTVLNEIIEKEKVTIRFEREGKWSSLREKYENFIKRVEELIEEGKKQNYVYKDLDSRAAAELIVNSMGDVPRDKKLLQNIQEMILRGLLKMKTEEGR
ncbi:TetR/AcrR family transcriptional regulator [Thermotoga sp. KOL6]|uniref:TetR/AcrR family transcriptional regulator n=1 Tax=Thermotoga sp. KOL6 TaxID=126741 RepID=UPI000C769001|nr:TetR/AcrR family transcriptional regulator [Thermotoga sp. KOL6]PLV58309.1 TetR family transcriptional regulator [Thermotoga sp. KOL6]